MEVSIQLSQASGVPYYRQIVDQIAQLIRSGRLAPESQLPSVRDLSSQLLVSLITTRRAYADLEAAGLIVRRQGYGTFVAKEVEMASREQVIAETRELLTGVVHRAREFGLGNGDVRAILDDILREKEKRDGTE